MSPACQPCFQQPTTESTKNRNEIKLKSELSYSEFRFHFFLKHSIPVYGMLQNVAECMLPSCKSKMVK